MGRFESIGPIQPFLKLQEGEWADVYKAYDTSHQRNVLLKRLKSELANDDLVADRFANEVRLMAQINHPNVVAILDSGHSASAVYFIAEFVDGKSLDQLLEAGPIPPRLAAYILRETAAGLNAAHDADIFHRDIKPANILISTDGEVKLTDFGMASLTDTAIAAGSEREELRGTLGYMAPELFFEGTAGISSDLFSLGATLAELLTGQPPFRGESSTEILDQILNHDPLPMLAANPRIDAALLQICQRLLQKKPAHRYENCSALITTLEKYLGKAHGFDGLQSVKQFIADPAQYDEPFSHEVNASAQQTLAEPPLKSTTPDVDTTRNKVRRFAWLPYTLLAAIFIVIGYFLLSDTTTAPVIELEPASAQANQLPPPENELASAIEPLLSAQDIDSIDTAGPGLPDELEDEPAIAQVITELPQTTQDAGIVEMPHSATGNLNVLCTPFCDVYLDSVFVGKAPPILPMELTTGIHQIELRNPDLPAHFTDVIIEAGQTDSLFVALRDFVGTIELNVFPWANVFIDNVSYGQIPPTQSFILTPGEHTLRLEHSELGTWTTTLLVAAGEKQPYTFNLKELLE